MTRLLGLIRVICVSSFTLYNRYRFFFIIFPTATRPTTARSAAKKILASPSVRWEFR